MWVTKLLIFPVEIRIYCFKTTKFGQKLAFLVNLGQALPAYSMPCWWLWRAGCISQDTYLLYVFKRKKEQNRPIRKPRLDPLPWQSSPPLPHPPQQHGQYGSHGRAPPRRSASARGASPAPQALLRPRHPSTPSRTLAIFPSSLVSSSLAVSSWLAGLSWSWLSSRGPQTLAGRRTCRRRRRWS